MPFIPLPPWATGGSGIGQVVVTGKPLFGGNIGYNPGSGGTSSFVGIREPRGTPVFPVPPLEAPATPPPAQEPSDDAPAAQPSEPVPPSADDVVIVTPSTPSTPVDPILSFVGAPVAVTPFKFVPTVEVTAKRIVQRTVTAALGRLARAVVANPWVLGLAALLFPPKLNKGEQEFLDAYYGQQNIGRLPNADAIPEIETRARRIRTGDVVPAPRPTTRSPAYPSPRDPTFTPFPAYEPLAQPDPEARPPRTPAKPPAEPADPFTFDPDEDDVWFRPGKPRPVKLPRVPLWPFTVTPIGPEGPITVPDPLRVPLPLAPPTPKTRPVAPPAGLPFDDPVEVPLPTARPTPQPTPAPSTRAPPRVDTPFGSPFSFPVFGVGPARSPKPSLRPDPLLGGPPTGADPCNCQKDKPKKKKSRKPRDVCYRGTYTERSKSLIKSRKEEIPCR